MSKVENKLPAYLGYGVLNPDSYKFTDGKAYADYQLPEVRGGNQ